MHPRLLLPPAIVASTSPRVRKRQRVDDEGREDAIDAEVDGASIRARPVPRGVELETAVERFLLRMYETGAEADAETAANVVSEDTEEEGADDDKIKMSGEDKQPQHREEEESDRRRWEIWLLGTLDSENNGAPLLPLPLPGEGDLEGNGNVKVGRAVLLQCGLRASNLEFVEGEVRVLQDVEEDSESSSGGAREGWAVEVRRWRWARC